MAAFGLCVRVGTLGHHARLDNVSRLLATLEAVLPRAGLAVPRGEVIPAAEVVFAGGPHPQRPASCCRDPAIQQGLAAIER